MAERLKKEEEERNARRKRVEAIMLRTRGRNQSNTSKVMLDIEYINLLAKNNIYIYMHILKLFKLIVFNKLI